jgi:aryl-alcohol dehydrogenase-like predicted oxidoreductase
MALAGRATAAGTARYAARLIAAGAASEHFRISQGLTLASIGAGTYLGEPTEAVDQNYREALAEAVRCGCNVLDTAVSYRAQRSEIALGQAIADLVAGGEAARDELVVASKGGFVTYRLTRPADRVQFVYDTFVATGVVEPEELAGGIHCIAPGFLSQQISWTLRNTGLHTIDIYYLHDPETQLAFVDRATFRNRLQLAFARLEEEVAAGRIGCYGIASWNGVRRPPMAADYLSLEILVQLAKMVAGDGHHLRVLQLPVNPSMAEPALFRNQSLGKKLVPSLNAARDLGLQVMTSASMMPTNLLNKLPASLDSAFPYLHSNAQKALQFARSLPGVTTVLAGMSRIDHVRENLGLTAHPPEPDKAERIARSLKQSGPRS